MKYLIGDQLRKPFNSFPGHFLSPPSQAGSGLSTNGAIDRTYSKTGKHSGLVCDKLSKLMRTIHISMTGTFQCEYCQCFTFKRCDKLKLKCTSHGGMYSAQLFWKN